MIVSPPDSSQIHAIHNISRSPSPARSDDDIFSVTSDNSSQSSQGDSDVEDQLKTATRRAEQSSEASLVRPTLQQNPRRSSNAVRPPSLPRQEERKSVFVQDLVDSATSLVSVIWPLANAPGVPTTGGRGVLPLRRYIEETLRRSRTSYSTLQVALYYLILVKPHIDQTSLDCPGVNTRAMQCGRRMFLAALILASKYLQDRNYSTKAWSKMSGLKATEINSNERLFLSAVCWKLHIPEPTFRRWADIVLRFTAPASMAGPGFGFHLWSKAMPFLTPELDDVRIASITPAHTMALVIEPPTIDMPIVTESSRPPLPSSVEVRPEHQRQLDNHSARPPTPRPARLDTLPTPQMTPSSLPVSTPAASKCRSQFASMSIAMTQASLAQFNRSYSDPLTGVPMSRSCSVRHPIYASPESMMSDHSRLSRSSSIASGPNSSIGAPCRISLRSAATSMSNGSDSLSRATDAGTLDQPIIIADDNALSSMISPACSRKRTRSPDTITISTEDEELESHIRALLMLQKADQLHKDGVDASKLPCRLRREAAVSIDLEQSSPCRKRICSGTRQGTTVQSPELLVQVGGEWQGVA